MPVSRVTGKATFAIIDQGTHAPAAGVLAEKHRREGGLPRQ